MTVIIVPCRSFIRLTVPRRFRRAQTDIWRCSRPTGHEGAHRDDIVEWEDMGTPPDGAVVGAKIITIKTDLSEADYERLKADLLAKVRKRGVTPAS